MKIFEINSNMPQVINKADYVGKTRKVQVTSIDLKNSDAAELDYNGRPIKGHLFVVGNFQNWKDIRDNRDITGGVLYHRQIDMDGRLVRVDDKQLTTAIVNAKDAENRSPGMIDKIKGKFADLVDPNDPTSDAYDILSREKNAGFKTNTDKISVPLIKGASKLGKGAGRQYKKRIRPGFNAVSNKIKDAWAKRQKPKERPTL